MTFHIVFLCWRKKKRKHNKRMGLMDVVGTVALKPLFLVSHFVLTLVGFLLVPLVLVKVAVTDGKRLKGLAKDNVRMIELVNELPYPLGGFVLRFVVFLSAGYTVSIGPWFEELKNTDKGGIMCKASMNDRPWLRNPFGSLHAVALTNLGEFASGTAMMTLFQRTKPAVRGIVTGIEIKFSKKARGKITAISELEPLPSDTKSYPLVISPQTKLVDASGEEVAVITVSWTISLKPDKKKN